MLTAFGSAVFVCALCVVPQYVADYTPAMQTVNTLSKNEGFTKWLKKQRAISDGMDLMSFLIMPVSSRGQCGSCGVGLPTGEGETVDSH